MTYQVGFLESPLANTLDALLKWQSEIGAGFGRRPSYEQFVGPLQSALMRLEPLTTPPTKVLLLETRSNWTAFFDNGLRMSDPESAVGHLCAVMPSRGIVVHCSPDRSEVTDRKALRIYGVVSFRMFGAHRTSWLNQERAIVAMNDGGSWVFSTEGTEQAFEEPEQYAARRIRDRLTDEMLERYCGACGIRLFDGAFYGPKAAIITTIQKLPP